jgi:hypothetical protein
LPQGFLRQFLEENDRSGQGASNESRLAAGAQADGALVLRAIQASIRSQYAIR